VKPVGIIRLLRRFRNNNQGASLVELTLLMPLLLALMGGAVEFGRAFQQHHIATKGVTSAARYLARVLNPELCPASGGQPDTTGTWNSDVDKAQLLAQKGTFDDSLPYLINDWRDGVTDSVFTASIVCIDNSAGAYRGLAEQPIITVSGEFRFRGIGMLGAINAIKGGTVDTNGWIIRASHEELYIGG
jgi:Flp pilus assembly pilin Flp